VTYVNPRRRHVDSAWHSTPSILSLWV